MSIEVTIERGEGAGEALAFVKAIVARHPGTHDVLVKVGWSRLKFGPGLRADADACAPALGEYGDVVIA